MHHTTPEPEIAGKSRLKSKTLDFAPGRTMIDYMLKCLVLELWTHFTSSTSL